MFIIEKPYASELIFDTILQNDWWVLDNQAVRDAEIEEGALRLITSNQAKDYYLKQEFPLIYSNSENAVDWVIQNLPKSNITSYIKIFKDKCLFRNNLQELFPDFYFREVELKELKDIDTEELRFPCVIKPAVGVLNIGVHTIKSPDEWKNTVSNIENEIKQSLSLYSGSVVDSSKFIVEEYIEGSEFAIDAYYDRNGEPVILNIFQHPFLNSDEANNRIHITSAEIMIRYMAKFGIVLKNIGDLINIKNFPMHMELRIKDDGSIIPIEVNPMRFGAWCTTDITKYAWKINPYEYFYKQKRPDWNEILSEAGRDIFYFSLIEIPKNVDKNKVQGFEYEKFLSNYPNVLELRRTNPVQTSMFAIVFGSTTDKHNIGKILELKVQDYVL